MEPTDPTPRWQPFARITLAFVAPIAMATAALAALYTAGNDPSMSPWAVAALGLTLVATVIGWDGIATAKPTAATPWLLAAFLVSTQLFVGVYSAAGATLMLPGYAFQLPVAARYVLQIAVLMALAPRLDRRIAVAVVSLAAIHGAYMIASLDWLGKGFYISFASLLTLAAGFSLSRMWSDDETETGVRLIGTVIAAHALVIAVYMAVPVPEALRWVTAYADWAGDIGTALAVPGVLYTIGAFGIRYRISRVFVYVPVLAGVAVFAGLLTTSVLVPEYSGYGDAYGYHAQAMTIRAIALLTIASSAMPLFRRWATTWADDLWTPVDGTPEASRAGLVTR